MKQAIRGLSLLALLFAIGAAPAFAGPLYTNGPINGTVDAWLMNFGFAVSDSFVLGSPAEVWDVTFAVWVPDGDVMTGVTWYISSGPLDTGTVYASGTSPTVGTFAFENVYDYDVDKEVFSISAPPELLAGTYWLTLSAATPGSFPIYWDENDGPSSAYLNGPVVIPSETFDVEAPEPASFGLLGIGIFGMFALLRRRTARS